MSAELEFILMGKLSHCDLAVLGNLATFADQRAEMFASYSGGRHDWWELRAKEWRHHAYRIRRMMVKKETNKGSTAKG